jgi:hypothetical protein
MNNEDDKKIFDTLENVFDIDGKKDKHLQANISLTVGVVVDTDDPLQEGRLRIFCPSLNDNPKKLQHLPWAAYVSPFGGVVNSPCFTRGSDPNNAQTEGAVHYGFWAIPEQGAHALVGCIDGDPRRRFFLGCFPQHQQTHTLFNGRYKWAGFNGTPDGPFSTSNNPIQPLYDNLTEAYVDRQAREWKTRGADYQATAISQTVGEIPNDKMKGSLDEQYPQISAAEPDQWVKDVLGAHGYDWTNLKQLGAFLSSKVYGMTSPGMHTLMMDDRAFNNRLKLRSTSGHMILLDDTNERIYVATSKGNNWIEMDSSGNIDIYSKRRVSVHAEDDINFSTDASFRVKAKKGIYMYAGDTPGTPLGSNIPPDGQIRIQSSDDMHIYSDKNIREFAKESIYMEATNNFEVTSKNWLQSCSVDFDLKAQNINLVAQGHVLASVASSNFQVDSTNITSDATGNVFFKTPAVFGSIISINETFLHKEDSSGSPMQPDPAPPITVPSITVDPSNSKISIWTNRVPQHEPWPRVLVQSNDKPINTKNDGYKNNVQWVPQFDNTTSPQGMEPIGKVEGETDIPRGMFWRR